MKRQQMVFGVDVQQLAAAIAPMLAAELARVLPEVASQIARDRGQAMTLNGARKLAKYRSELVRMAMATGALRSKQSGRRWITTAGEVADWIKRGRPAIG